MTGPEPPVNSDQKESLNEFLAKINAEGRERWAQITAEAKRIGITPKKLERLLPHLGLSRSSFPLSPEAVAAIHQHIETAERVTDGQARHRQQQLETIADRLKASPGLAQQILDHCGLTDLTADPKAVTQYLLAELERFGIKPYRKLCSGLWIALRDLVPGAGLLDITLHDAPVRRAWFWGVILRLPQLQGDAPARGDQFIEWSQVLVHHEHQQRKGDQSVADMLGFLTGQAMTDALARQILNLPEQGTELTRKAISDAYKLLARDCHPDAGGDAVQFQRITEARKRLLFSQSQ